MKFCGLIVVIVIVAGVARSAERNWNNTDKVAVVEISGPSHIKGTLTFRQSVGSNEVTLDGIIHGLSEGTHGFHIHNDGVKNGDCQATGDHFDVHGTDHGSPDHPESHNGDLGNILADGEGRAIVNMVSRKISLEESSEYSVIGRSMVVHAAIDDLGLGNETDSKVNGHSGARIACGTIVLV